jgi:hypothetical protein
MLQTTSKRTDAVIMSTSPKFNGICIFHTVKLCFVPSISLSTKVHSFNKALDTEIIDLFRTIDWALLSSQHDGLADG